jgi:hypothetical protein
MRNLIDAGEVKAAGQKRARGTRRGRALFVLLPRQCHGK